MAKKYFTIAGYGKYKYIKKISGKKAKELEEDGKEIYSSYDSAKTELNNSRK